MNPIAAAVILADKTDVRRSRVRAVNGKDFDNSFLAKDIHDRVNYAVEKSSIYFTNDNSVLVLDLTIDLRISPVMEYFEIFLSRMILCRRAAQALNIKFELIINNSKIL